MTLDELIAGITEHADDDEKAKELADAIRAKAKPVAQVLLNAGAAMQKTEGRKDTKKVEQERDEAIRERDELRTEFDEFKAKTPNAKEIEDRVTARYEPKLKALKDQVAERDTALKSTIQRGGLTKFSRELIKLGADPEYAQVVAAEKHRDRLAPKDDGSLGVLQIGSTLEYDGVDEDEKISALARDAIKTVPPKFINTNADSGGGVRNGSGGGTALKTVDQIRKEKEQSSAFTGF